MILSLRVFCFFFVDLIEIVCTCIHNHTTAHYTQHNGDNGATLTDDRTIQCICL